MTLKKFTFLHTIVYREIILKNLIWDLVETSDVGPIENII